MAFGKFPVDSQSCPLATKTSDPMESGLLAKLSGSSSATTWPSTLVFPRPNRPAIESPVLVTADFVVWPTVVKAFLAPTVVLASAVVAPDVKPPGASLTSASFFENGFIEASDIPPDVQPVFAT